MRRAPLLAALVAPRPAPALAARRHARARHRAGDRRRAPASAAWRAGACARTTPASRCCTCTTCASRSPPRARSQPERSPPPRPRSPHGGLIAATQERLVVPTQVDASRPGGTRPRARASSSASRWPARAAASTPASSQKGRDLRPADAGQAVAVVEGNFAELPRPADPDRAPHRRRAAARAGRPGAAAGAVPRHPPRGRVRRRGRLRGPLHAAGHRAGARAAARGRSTSSC